MLPPGYTDNELVPYFQQIKLGYTYIQACDRLMMELPRIEISMHDQAVRGHILDCSMVSRYKRIDAPQCELDAYSAIMLQESLRIMSERKPWPTKNPLVVSAPRPTPPNTRPSRNSQETPTAPEAKAQRLSALRSRLKTCKDCVRRGAKLSKYWNRLKRS